MTTAIEPFNIMAKPVCGVCNLACRYCYYIDKPAQLYPGVANPRMSDEVLESYTRQYMEAMPRECTFGWQGGEPLLAGKAFFARAMELQNKYRRPGQGVANALQTNGTLVDEEWASFLADNKFLVGISLDGPPQWHDSFRRDGAGGPSFHRAWAGLELLARHGAEFNVLVTLNSINAPHAGDIYRYFVNRGIRYLQFIPILERTADDQPTDFSCTGEQFGRLMIDVFDLWAARDVGKVSERLIDCVLHTIIYGRSSMCCHAKSCANAYVLEWNGDLYACDHFVYRQWRVGNIQQEGLAQLLASEKLREFSLMKRELPALCRDCEFLAYCNGGCPKHHRPIGTDPARVNHFCEGYKTFFRHALPELKRVAEYVKFGRLPPAKTAGPEGARPVGGAVGRNEPCSCGSGRKYKNCCGRGKI
ncbi:MAG: anaerobic sulfatase maturase [Phycisphaerae bacterium]|jgi:uncharacterized protein